MPRGRKRAVTVAEQAPKEANIVKPTVTSVSAARLANQSTIDLVAQLSENLPQYMNIDFTLREHNEKVQQACRLRGGTSSSSSSVHLSPERKKRKYERKIKKEPVEVENESTPTASDSRESLILRLPRPLKQEEPEHPSQQPTFGSQSSAELSQSEPFVWPPVSTGKKVNWLTILPSMEELERRAAKKEAKKRTKLENHNEIYMLRDDFFALPYLDDPTVPDFIKYKYPNQKQYYMDEDKA